MLRREFDIIDIIEQVIDKYSKRKNTIHNALYQAMTYNKSIYYTIINSHVLGHKLISVDPIDYQIRKNNCGVILQVVNQKNFDKVDGWKLLRNTFDTFDKLAYSKNIHVLRLVNAGSLRYKTHTILESIMAKAFDEKNLKFKMVTFNKKDRINFTMLILYLLFQDADVVGDKRTIVFTAQELRKTVSDMFKNFVRNWYKVYEDKYPYLYHLIIDDEAIEKRIELFYRKFLPDIRLLEKVGIIELNIHTEFNYERGFKYNVYTISISEKMFDFLTKIAYWDTHRKMVKFVKLPSVCWKNMSIKEWKENVEFARNKKSNLVSKLYLAAIRLLFMKSDVVDNIDNHIDRKYIYEKFLTKKDYIKVLKRVIEDNFVYNIRKKILTTKVDIEHDVDENGELISNEVKFKKRSFMDIVDMIKNVYRSTTGFIKKLFTIKDKLIKLYKRIVFDIIGRQWLLFKQTLNIKFRDMIDSTDIHDAGNDDLFVFDM